MFDPCSCCCMRWKLRRSPPHTAQSKGFKLYKGPCKRTQQVPTTTPNIVVIPCKRTQQFTTLLGPTLLGVVGQQCCVRLHGPKSLTGQFKLYATSANIVVAPCKRTQQVTTLLGPTMLGVVGQHDVGSVCMGLNVSEKLRVVVHANLHVKE